MRRGCRVRPIEAIADPQIAHRQALAEVKDGGGSFKVINPPYRLSEGETSVQGFAAALGEHSRVVLAELGYDAAAIEALIASGVAA